MRPCVDFVRLSTINNKILGNIESMHENDLIKENKCL